MRQSKLDRVVQVLIPPSLILLLTLTIIELFYNVGYQLLIDIFDTYILIIFAIDLYYRWKETPQFGPYVKKHWLEIIATIPFNFIFYGIQGLTLIRALRGVRILTRVARLGRFTRLARLLRLPRFTRMKKQVKEGKIRKVQPHQKKMKGVLSFKVILLITINSIMGTGIWFLTSAGAKYAGPASLVSWVILSLIAVYISMCFGELVSMFPKAGGVYEFGKQAYGRFASFVIGWTTSISGSVTIAMLILGALQYLLPNSPQYYIPIAISLIVAFSYVAFRGMNTSTYMLVTFALITLTAVIGIIIPGLINFDIGKMDPFFVFPTMGIALAIFFIAETFFGWESAIFLAAETKNPSKVMPRALVIGTVVIAILAFLLAFTAMGTIPWQEFSESTAPLRDLGAAHFGDVGGIVFAFLIFISVIGATAGWIVTAPRLLMAIAEDKLFFTQFAKIHPKHKSPYISIIFQVLVVSVLVFVGAGSYETLLHMLIPLILVLYSSVLLAVVILRFKKPDLKRNFKVPFGKVGPVLTIGFMIFLLVMFIKETHGALDILRVSGSLILFGIPAYFAIELFYDPKYVSLRKETLVKLTHHFHKLPRLHTGNKRLLNCVSPLNKNSKIIDYNSPVGMLSRLVLKKKKKYGSLVAVNSTKEAVKQLKELKIKTVYARQGQVPVKGNVFISYNDLGYVTNMDKFVLNVSKSLSKNGKFCFYVGSHFLNVAPNANEVHNKKEILKLMKKHKLKASYKMRRLGFKQDVYIYGKKV
nr:APC family permease [Candidatus Woesearchaeota archaeon]